MFENCGEETGKYNSTGTDCKQLNKSIQKQLEVSGNMTLNSDISDCYANFSKTKYCA